MGKSYSDVDAQAINLIGKGTKITGDVMSDGDIRIDGTLIGNLECKGRLVVGATGTVDGEIKCKTSEISGMVKGKVIISELLSLKATCKITGDIVTGKLSIEPGAVFSGSCNMGSEKKTNEPKQLQS